MNNELKDRKILIIDDDVSIGAGVAMACENNGALPYVATDGGEGLKMFYQVQPDLVILDVMLPDTTGWVICQQIRQLANTPVIMLTGLDKDDEIIKSLDAGADDFIHKPFKMNVLLAHMRAILRRFKRSKETETAVSGYKDGYLQVEPSRNLVTIQEQPIRLTATELRLLYYLVQNANRVCTYEQILESVWGWEYQDSIAYVHVYVSHLRQKIEVNPSEPLYFITHHGIGYEFAHANLPSI